LKKWLNWIALVVVFSIACGFLANWQFSRRESKLASIALVKENYNAIPVELNTLLENGSVPLPKMTWRTVRISGHYLPESLLLVRNRPNEGQPGFEELVPFQSDQLGVLFVSRGWLPSGQAQDQPDSVPVPSREDTIITARILAAEPLLNRGAPDGQIASINVSLALELTGLNSQVNNSYFRLVAESPAVGEGIKPMHAPSIEEGNNLSYAFQWILFALMAALALIWRIRRDNQLDRGIVPKRRIRHSDLDAAYEDASTKAK
jgi:cytochrome oxidase assembly protein ShyY1